MLSSQLRLPVHAFELLNLRGGVHSAEKPTQSWPSNIQAPLAKDYAEDNVRLRGVIDTMQTAEQVVGDSRLPREARVGKHKLGQVEHHSFDHAGEAAVRGTVHTPDAPHHAAFGTASGSGRSAAAGATPGHTVLGTSSAARTTQEVSDLDEAEHEARVAAARADALEEAAEEADALLEDRELQAQAAEEAANAVEAAHGTASALQAADDAAKVAETEADEALAEATAAEQAAAVAELEAEQAAVAADEAAAALEVDTYGSTGHARAAEAEPFEEDMDLLQGRTLFRQQGSWGTATEHHVDTSAAQHVSGLGVV